MQANTSSTSNSNNASVSSEPAAAAAAPVATSTSKALLLSIAVPKIYRIYVPPKERLSMTAVRNSSHPQIESSTRSTGTANNPSTKPPMVSKDSTLSADSRHSKLAREEKSLVPTDQTSVQDTLPATEPDGISKTWSKVTTLLTPSADDGNNTIDEEELGVRVVQVEDGRYSSTFEAYDVGYVEAEDDEGSGSGSDRGRRQKSIVEHVVTKEEMDLIVKLTEDSSEKDEEKKSAHDDNNLETDEKESKAPLLSESDREDSGVVAAASEVVKNFFGVMTTIGENEEDFNGERSAGKSAYLTREDAVHAIKNYEPSLRLFSQSTLQACEEDKNCDKSSYKTMKPNTEIKLEELLRLTFKNLYLENHFYNAPIYSNVETRLLEDHDMDQWVDVSVMAKEASIGIILERLERIGVGSSVGTIAMFKTELLKSCDILNNAAAKDAKPRVDSEEMDAEEIAKIELAQAEWKNAASRLRVEQLRENIEGSAQLSLDFLVLLTVASILAGIGLVADNVVVIVASMLVSPIMGPVMGMTFGTQTLDWELAFSSTWHELVSLLLAILVGALIGIATAFAPVADSWPTEQMAIRGDVGGIIQGIAIALPSGMGVAVSILGDQTSALVGVAISASLLPPAVNAGTCWVFAILIAAGVLEADDYRDDEGNNYDFNAIASISFALVIVNIVCIWVGGIFMFHIKEVAPTRSKSAFWSRDIKVARAVHRGHQNVLNLDAVKAGLQDVISKERERVKGDISKGLGYGGERDEDSLYLERHRRSSGRNASQYYTLEDLAKRLGIDWS